MFGGFTIKLIQIILLIFKGRFLTQRHEPDEGRFQLIMDDKLFDTVLDETRKFAPAAAFTEKAHIKSLEEYKAKYDKSLNDPEGFWGDGAEELHWFKKWDKVLDDTDAPYYKWYVGGQTNIAGKSLEYWARARAGEKPSGLRRRREGFPNLVLQ